MSSIFDVVMVILFILFMVFLFGGYHRVKSGEREAQFKREEEEKKRNLI